jgi:cyanophycin synthetase
MIQNLLPAVLAAYTQGAKIEEIRSALLTFIPSPQTTPGRLNVFKFRHFDVMVDYAHNPAGMRALQAYLLKVDASPKVGVISAAGDRRDNDIRELGRISAEIFDEIIIRQDKNLRGRKDVEIMRLIEEGIREVSSTIPITKINPEKESIRHALETARPGSHITICSDVITEALDLVMQYKEAEDSGVQLSVKG